MTDLPVHTGSADFRTPLGFGAVSRPSLTSRERVLSLAAIAPLFLIVFGAALRAQFGVLEDHLLLAGLDWGISDWLVRIRTDIAEFQRVRPAYWIYMHSL